jgi:sacsin
MLTMSLLLSLPLHCSFATGDYLVILDPHKKYLPGGTAGLKVKFTDSYLVDQFEDQFTPFLHFDCDLQSRFEGTLFR